MSDAEQVIRGINNIQHTLFYKMQEQNTLLTELIKQMKRIADSIESNTNNNLRSP